MTHQTDEYKRATKIVWWTIIGLMIFCVIAAGHNNAAKHEARAQLADCAEQRALLQEEMTNLIETEPVTIIKDPLRPRELPTAFFGTSEKARKEAIRNVDAKREMGWMKAKMRVERMKYEAELQIKKAEYDRQIDLLKAETEGRVKEVKATYEKKAREILAENASAHGEGGALVVKDGWKWKQSDGGALAYGCIINRSSFTVTEAKVQFRIKDKDGDQVENVFHTYKDISLAPGERMEFWLNSPSWQEFYQTADILILHVVYEWRS